MSIGDRFKTGQEAPVSGRYRCERARITPTGNGRDHTLYMLVSPTERHNIEVFVLKHYLNEKLGIVFRSRRRTR